MTTTTEVQHHSCVYMQDNKWKDTLDRWADDLSCALFALANVVTIMYYIVDTSTGVRASACTRRHFSCLRFKVHSSPQMAQHIRAALAASEHACPYRQPTRFGMTLLECRATWKGRASHGQRGWALRCTSSTASSPGATWR